MSRIALITGASRGLGRSMAEHLARDGWGVLGTYSTNRAAAEEAVAGIEQHGGSAAMLPFDAAEPDAVPRLVSAVRETLHSVFGAERLDALVNNAGIGEFASFAETTEAQFDRVVLTNLRAPFFLTQQLLPVLADGSRVLNVSTGLARFTNPGYAAYAATKGAIEVLTRYQAKELAPRGIRVNVIAPGAIATDFSGGAVRDVPEVARAVAAQVALGRAGEPDEIGAAVAAILSDGFRWVDGTRIEVSGGQAL